MIWGHCAELAFACFLWRGQCEMQAVECAENWSSVLGAARASELLLRQTLMVLGMVWWLFIY